ncbi:LysR family transcriptional regulator [Oceanimonas sp. NS1]|nr:LysR family transcriptional regulator [Oceanimonas sp. NS1]
MKPLFKQLPPLQTLTFFEAAARHASFTRAADELCVTQSAVSKQIKLLEEYLGAELFYRERRQVMLTDDGLELFAEVKTMLGQLADSCNRIRSHVYSKNVTIVSTVAVAHYWLFPRIARFNMEFPDININIYATDEITEDLCRKSDMGILYGYEQWQSNLTGHYLFRERIYPVCAHDLPLTDINRPEDLLNNRIVHLDPLKWRWVNWGDWFRHFGIHYQVPGHALVFNQVPLAMNAALQEWGSPWGGSLCSGRCWKTDLSVLSAMIMWKPAGPITWFTARQNPCRPRLVFFVTGCCKTPKPIPPGWMPWSIMAANRPQQAHSEYCGQY